MKKTVTQKISYPVPIKWSCKDWTVCYTKAEMLNTAELDQFSDQVKVHRTPDIFYGYNSIYLVNQKHDFVYRVTAVEALQFCAFEVREKQPLLRVGVEGETEEIKNQIVEQNTKFSESKEIYNPLNFIPTTILAKQSEVWMKKDFNSIKDFQKIEPISDWTYTTPYKGSLSYLSKCTIPNFVMTASSTRSSVEVGLTMEQIPFHKLGKDNPVLHFDEIPLFEDDLDDLGFAQAVVRCRVMADSVYMLLRNYVRVDNLFVRVIDTRIYHELGTSCILREFQYKENTYEELKKKGFEFTSDWILSPTQADTVSPHLDLKVKVMDKIMI